MVGEEHHLKKEWKEDPNLKKVSLVLDSYEDIFSDFDPRPYARRKLSEDFLRELKSRYSEDSRGKFQVIFLMPKSMRDNSSEEIIKKRLKSYFSRRLKETKEEHARIKRRGMHYLTVGVALLTALASIYINFEDELIISLSEIAVVPGWFAIWTGLDKIFEGSSETGKQKEFYEKFVKCTYSFVSIEPEKS